MENKTSKICEICGDEFIPTQKTQKKCKKKHYRDCEICGNPFHIEYNRPQKTCSNTCASEYRKKNVSYEKECAFCGEKFTTTTKHTKFCSNVHYKDCVVCNEKFVVKDLHRPSETCSQSCGSKLSHNESSAKKRIENSIKKHGVEHPFQAKEVKAKIKNSLDNSENDTRFGSKKMKNIIKEKYGVENVSQLEEVQKAKEKTYYEKYGVLNPAAMQINNYKEWNDFQKFVEGKNWDCLELADFFNTSVGTIRQKAYKTQTESLIKGFHEYSEPELKIKKILESFGLKESIDFTPHNRQLIKPLEVDFYIPSLNLAIEVSPTFTHNSKLTWSSEDGGLPMDYHQNKYLKCKEIGVDLITIFDWHKEERLKSILVSKLRKNLETYKYKENIDIKNMYEFLGLEHQTYSNKKYHINGLFKNNEPVAVFVWLENRNSTTLKYYKNKTQVNIDNVIQVLIGKYSKYLLKNNIKSMIINSDLSIDLQASLVNLGFNTLKEVSPRVNYYNHKSDMNIKSKKKTKRHFVALENRGFLPVYDCGHCVMLLDITI